MKEVFRMKSLVPVTCPIDAAKIDKPVMSPMTISKTAAEAFKNFLKKNKEYLQQSAGVFHTDNHSNW